MLNECHQVLRYEVPAMSSDMKSSVFEMERKGTAISGIFKKDDPRRQVSRQPTFQNLIFWFANGFLVIFIHVTPFIDAKPNDTKLCASFQVLWNSSLGSYNKFLKSRKKENLPGQNLKTVSYQPLMLDADRLTV